MTTAYADSPQSVGAHWRRRVFNAGDVAGVIAVLIPVLLFAFAIIASPAIEIAMYVVAVVAVLPCLPRFLTSVHKSGASLLLVLLFVALALSTAAAFSEGATTEVLLRAKGFAATAVWASIYIVVYTTVKTGEAADRFIRWVEAICCAISASVWAGALLHVVGVSFGEVILQGDSFRAFGPLGDQVAWVVVLPALMSLAAGRPILFGFHTAAVLLTGTRGALLCLLIGVLGHFIFGARGKTARRTLQLAAVVVVCGIVWMTPAADALKERFNEPSMRTEAFEAGLNVVRKSPFIGFGFNGLDPNRAAVAEDWLVPEQAASGLSRASNQYLQTAVDGGVLALVLLLLFVGFEIRNAFRLARWPAASPQLVASQLWLIAVFLGNQTAPWLLSDTACGFFTFAIAGLAARAYDLSSSRNEKPASHRA